MNSRKLTKSSSNLITNHLRNIRLFVNKCTLRPITGPFSQNFRDRNPEYRTDYYLIFSTGIPLKCNYAELPDQNSKTKRSSTVWLEIAVLCVKLGASPPFTFGHVIAVLPFFVPPCRRI